MQSPKAAHPGKDILLMENVPKPCPRRNQHRHHCATQSARSFLCQEFRAFISAGYCLGTIFQWDAARRQRFLPQLGLGLTVAFIVLRAINIYGDPSRWNHQASTLFTLLSFLNTTKYPPSLAFLLMTLGPAIALTSWLERLHFSSTNPLIVFGRVPFFYYVAHLAVAHLIAIVLNFVRYGSKPFLWLAPPSMGSPSELFPPDYGFPLWVVYAVWVVVLLLLYPACLGFSRLKQRRHDWWLSYL